MKDKELEILTSWRYTRVEKNDKKPFPCGWQKNWLPLTAIPQDENIGVLLGEASNGLMALDFDGPTAWTWFAANIGCDLPQTVMWASGKDARCQMAFDIPQEYWEFIRTRKLITKPGIKDVLKPEQMEFRWNGCQSVLPPSIHPEKADGYEYAWVVPPSACAVARIPDEILSWLLLQGVPKQRATPTQGNIATIPINQFGQLQAVLLQLQRYQPVLDYDTWIKVLFATANEIGDSAAAFLLATIWPEQKEGEYMAHLRGRDSARSPTMGTLVRMVKELQGVTPKWMNNKNKF